MEQLAFCFVFLALAASSLRLVARGDTSLAARPPARAPLGCGRRKMGLDEEGRVSWIRRRAARILGVDLECESSTLRSHASHDDESTRSDSFVLNVEAPEKDEWEKGGAHYRSVAEWSKPHRVSSHRQQTPMLAISYSAENGGLVPALLQAAVPIVSRSVFFVRTRAAGDVAAPVRQRFSYGVIPAGSNVAVMETMFYVLAQTAIKSCLTQGAPRTEALRRCELANADPTSTGVSSAGGGGGGGGGGSSCGGLRGLSQHPGARGASPFAAAIDESAAPIPDTVEPARMDVTAMGWVRYIKGLLSGEPPPGCTVGDEVEGWREQGLLIKRGKTALESSGTVREILRRVRENGSLLARTLDELFERMDTEAVRVTQWAAHLTPLVRLRNRMSEDILPSAHEWRDASSERAAETVRLQLFADLFETIGCLSNHSDYATPARLSALFTQFADLLTEEVKDWLHHTQESRIIGHMGLAKDILCSFKETFLVHRRDKKAFRSCPIRVPFVSLDRTVERIRDIHEILSSRALLYTQLSANLPNNNAQKNIGLLHQLRNEIQTVPFVPYELLTCDEAQFDTVYRENAEYVKSFEIRLGVLLVDVVSDTTVFKQAARSCESFAALKDRRYFRDSWLHACDVLANMFQRELLETRRTMQRFRATGLPKCLPRCAEIVCVCDGLKERVETSCLARVLPHTPLMQQAQVLSDQLDAMKNSVLKQWAENASNVVLSLKPGLLKHNPATGEIYTSLCSSVTSAVQEGICLRRLDKGIELPEAVQDVVAQWATVRKRQHRLERLCFQFTNEMRRIPAAWAKLLDPEFRQARKVLRQGYFLENQMDDADDVGGLLRKKKGEVEWDDCAGDTAKMSWAGGYEVDKFFADSDHAVKTITKAIAVLHSPIEAADCAFVELDKTNNIFPFESRVGNHTLRLEDEWAVFYNQHKEERLRQLRSMNQGLIGVALQKLNTLRLRSQMIDETNEEWADYAAQITSSLAGGALRLVENALQRLKTQLTQPSTSSCIPLISFSLVLQEGCSLGFSPPEQDVRDAISEIINDILQYPTLLPEVASEFATAGVVVQDEPSIAGLLRDITEAINKELEEADNCLEFFSTQVENWDKLLRAPRGSFRAADAQQQTGGTALRSRRLLEFHPTPPVRAKNHGHFSLHKTESNLSQSMSMVGYDRLGSSQVGPSGGAGGNLGAGFRVAPTLARKKMMRYKGRGSVDVGSMKKKLSASRMSASSDVQEGGEGTRLRRFEGIAPLFEPRKRSMTYEKTDGALLRRVGALPIAPDLLGRLLRDCEGVGSALRQLPSSKTLGILLLDTRPLKNELAAAAGNVYRRAVEMTHQAVEDTVTSLEDMLAAKYEKIYQASIHTAATPPELFEILASIRDTSDREKDLHEKSEPLLPAIQTLKKHQAIPSQRLLLLEERVRALPRSWAKIKARIGVVRASIRTLQDKEVVKWLDELGLLNKKLAGFVKAATKQLPDKLTSTQGDPYVMLSQTRADIALLAAEEKWHLSVGSMLEVTHSISQELSRFTERVQSLKSLWDLVYHIQSSVLEWSAVFLDHFDPEKLQATLDSLEGDLVLSSMLVKTHPLYTEVYDTLKEWHQAMPLLRRLHQSSFLQRHWVALLGTCGGQLETCLRGSHRVDCIMQSGIEDDDPKLVQLLRRSAHEAHNEAVVRSLAARWEGTVVPMRWGGSLCLKSWMLSEHAVRELICLAGDDKESLHRIEDEPVSWCHIDDVQRWLSLMGCVVSVLTDWLEIQREWSDVVLGMHNEANSSAYKRLHSSYLEQMADVHKQRGGKPAHLLAVLEPMRVWMSHPMGIRMQLSSLESRFLEKVESCCATMPRLYALSYATLRHLFSLEQDHRRAAVEFWQVAPGCARTQIQQTGHTLPVQMYPVVVGFLSADGSDQLVLTQEYECQGRIDQLYAGLLSAVHATVREEMHAAWVMVYKCPRSEWCIGTFTQQVVFAAHVAFSLEIDTMYDQLEDGNPDACSLLHSTMAARLKMHSSVLRGVGGLHSYICSVGALVSLDANDKKRISSLVIVELHHRDVLETLMRNEAFKSTDFSWQSQLRIRWNAAEGRPVGHAAFGCVVPVGEELVPCATGLMSITTPQTLRCRILALLALRMNTCATIVGPTSAGKVEIIRDLSGVLAHHLIVVVCTATTSPAGLSRIFAVLMKTTAWLCLARVDQLSPVNLAVASQHISETLRLRRAGQMSGVVACTLTNRSAAGGGAGPRLPDDLSGKCQLVSLMAVSIEAVATTALMSFGMKNAKLLGAKLGAFYEHGRKILPHVSWSLPSLKITLVLARARWKTGPDRVAVAGAVHSVHVANLSGEDLVIASHLLRSLFPPVVHGSMPIVETILRQNYSTGEGNEFATACNRVIASLAQRRALCVLGPPGCGKTVLWNLAGEALGWARSGVRVLFPSSLPHETLHAVIRAEAKRNVKIIVLDGIPGPWLEDLAHNFGDGVTNDPVTGKERRTVIEALNLNETTPGIVTRVGIVALKPTDVGWLGVKDRWASSLPAEAKAPIDYMCDTHLAAVFDYHRRHLGRHSELNLLETIQYTIDVLLLRVKKSGLKSSEAVFAVAVFWSLLAQTTTRKQVDAFLLWWRREFPPSNSVRDPTDNPSEDFLEMYNTYFETAGTDPLAAALEPISVGLSGHQKFAGCYASLLLSRKSVCIAAERGLGRTTVLTRVVQGCSHVMVQGNAWTEASAWAGSSAAADGGKHVVVAVDDVHVVPACPKETMREWMQTRSGVSFLCSTLARNEDFGNTRLARRLTVVYLNDEEALLWHIAEKVGRHFAEYEGGQREQFSAEVQGLAQTVTVACVDFVQNIEPDEHSLFNLTRSEILSKMLTRLRLSRPGAVKTTLGLVSLWRYEASRVVLDATDHPENLESMQETLDQSTLSAFSFVPDGDEEMQTLLTAAAAAAAAAAAEAAQKNGDASEALEESDTGVAFGDENSRTGRASPHDALATLMWLPVSDGQWQHGRAKRPTSIQELAAITKDLNRKSGSLSVWMIAKHVGMLADTLDSGNKVTIVAGPTGCGKLTIATYAAKLAKLEPMVYDGGDNALVAVRHRAARNTCYIIKENALPGGKRTARLFHELADAQHLQVMIVCNTDDTQIGTLRLQFAAVLNNAQLYYIPQLSLATKVELVYSELVRDKLLLGSLSQARALSEFIVYVHVTSTESAQRGTASGGLSLRRLYDMIRCSGIFFKQMSDLDMERKKAMREGMVKTKTASQQGVLLESRLGKEQSLAGAQERHAEKAKEVHEKAKAQFHAHCTQQAAIQRSCDTMAADLQEIGVAVAQHMSAAQPYLEQAAAAAKTLDKALLQDLRALAKPAGDIVLVCVAAMILTSEGRIPKERTWTSARKTMQSPSVWLQSFQAFDVSSVQTAQFEFVAKMVRENKVSFQPSILASKSPACSYLCEWLLKTVAYLEAISATRPKEDKHAAIKQSLDATKGHLQKMKEKTRLLKTAVDAAYQELSSSEGQRNLHSANARATQAKIERAKHLVEALDNDKWCSSFFDYPLWGIGDSVLLAALVTHAGPFSEERRRQLLRGKWPEFLGKRKVFCGQTQLPSLRQAEIARWATKSLPTDTFTLESAMAATKSLRHTLLIDPHNAAGEWLLTIYTGAQVVSASSPDYVEDIIRCVVDNRPVILTGVHEPLAPLFDGLLDTHFPGLKPQDIVINCKRYTVRKRFRICAVSNRLACQLPTRLLEQFNTVNFQLSDDRMTQLLVTEVTKVSAPELQAEYEKTCDMMHKQTIELQGAEDQLLVMLSTAEGELLDKPDLVTALHHMRLQTTELGARYSTLAKRLEEVREERSGFVPVTTRCFYLMRQALALEGLSLVYTFDVGWYLGCVQRAYAKAVSVVEGGDSFVATSRGYYNRNAEISVLAASAVCEELSFSIFSKHYVMFTSALCLAILREEQPRSVPPHLLKAFLDGPTLPAELGTFVESGPPWLSEDKWRQCVALEDNCPDVFAGLTVDLHSHARWEVWYWHPTAEQEMFPGEWSSLTPFKSLLLIRCLRPDRLPAAVELFVKDELGVMYVTPPRVDIPQILDSGGGTVVLWTGVGCDLLAAAEGHFERECTTIPTLHHVDGYNPGALAEIEAAASRGECCVVQSVHLYPDILPRLAALSAVPSFLLLCSADPEEAHRLPMAFLRKARKIAPTSTDSMKAILQASWDRATAKPSAATRHEYKTLLFLVVYFHAACMMRNRTGRYGFLCAPYAFGTQELMLCHTVLESWLSEDTPIPWADLQVLIANIVYGSHSGCGRDIAVMHHLATTIINAQQLQQTDMHGISTLPSQSLAEIGQSISAVQWSGEEEIQLCGLSRQVVSLREQEQYTNLPAAIRVFFYSERDDAADGDADAEDLFAGADGGGAQGGNKQPAVCRDNVRAEINAILKGLPNVDASARPPVRRASLQSSPMQELAASEWAACCTLVRTVTRDLLSPDGLVASPEVHAAVEATRVPARWVACGFDTELPLASWLQSLRERAAFLQAWDERRTMPAVMMIHLLFRPKRFFLCVLLTGATDVGLEAKKVVAEVSNKTLERVELPARNGVHVWGFQLLLCKWNKEQGCLDLAHPHDAIGTLPVITFRAAAKQEPAAASDTKDEKDAGAGAAAVSGGGGGGMPPGVAAGAGGDKKKMAEEGQRKNGSLQSFAPTWDCPVFSTQARTNLIIELPLPTYVSPEVWGAKGASSILEWSGSVM